MADKPPVLVLAGRYRPGYRAGGPVASVENLVRVLGGEFDFRVLALDHDLGDPTPYSDASRRPEAIYLPLAGAAARIRKEVKRARGVVYVQSLFDPFWGLMPLMTAPRKSLLVSPRGQLAPGALAFGGPKKRIALGMLRARGLGRALWQATADSDADEMRRAAPWIASDRIVVAPNLPSDPGFSPRRKPVGNLKAIYVGRIDPKKNLLTAVRAAAAAGVELEVVGPAEDTAYAEECRRAAAASERVTFAGALPPDAVRERLAGADAFLFPTHGENYGHSIVEAMLSGLPALIGDATPWRNLEATKAGFDLPPDDVDGFAAALQKLAKMPEEEYVRWSEGARATIDALTDREAAVEASRRMLWKAFENEKRR